MARHAASSPTTQTAPADATPFGTPSAKELESRYVELDPRPEVRPRRVSVLVHMPHVGRWRHETTKVLCYRWPGGKLAVGDTVELPPMPYDPKPHYGLVVHLKGVAGYSGDVKDIVRRVS